MSITREKLEQMKREVATAERELEKELAESQRSVVWKLSDINEQIKTLIREADTLANSVELRFYWHSGYDEFVWSDSDKWDSSSANC